MDRVIKLEEAGLFVFGIFLFNQLDYAWWWFLVLLLLPDLSMLGYLANPKFGAYVYNFFHYRALAVLVYYLGFQSGSQALLLTGVILFAHSSMDRIFGYGFKYTDSFQSTHLGKIGQ